MQSLYFVTRSAHSSWALFELEKSMHSSRFAFSSVQTQQGYATFNSHPISLRRASYLWLRRRAGSRLEVCAHVGGRWWRRCRCCHPISEQSSPVPPRNILDCPDPIAKECSVGDSVCLAVHTSNHEIPLVGLGIPAADRRCLQGFGLDWTK